MVSEKPGATCVRADDGWLSIGGGQGLGALDGGGQSQVGGLQEGVGVLDKPGRSQAGRSWRQHACSMGLFFFSDRNSALSPYGKGPIWRENRVTWGRERTVCWGDGVGELGGRSWCQQEVGEAWGWGAGRRGAGWTYLFRLLFSQCHQQS